MTDNRLEERLERFSEQVMLLFEQHLDDALDKTSPRCNTTDDDDSETCLVADTKSEYDDDITTTTTEEDIDDDESVDLEMDLVHNDLSNTAESLSTLELEFSKDLEALAFGIESAFDNFEEDDLIQLTKCTQTNFKKTVKKSLERNQRKRQRRTFPVESDILIPVCLDDFYKNQPEQQQQQQQSRTEGREDKEFQSWFQQVWSSIQSALLNKQQQSQNTVATDDSTLYRVWTQE